MKRPLWGCLTSPLMSPLVTWRAHRSLRTRHRWVVGCYRSCFHGSWSSAQLLVSPNIQCWISTHPSANTTDEAESVTSDELLGCARSTRGSRRAKSLGAQSLSGACTVKSGRALGTADGPELLQLATKFLASSRPVVCDVLSQILDVALEVQLVLLEPADIEFLAGCSTLELSSNVLLVVANDSTGVRIIVETKVKKPPYLVMRPVVLTPSVRWVTRNLPAALMGW